MTLNCEIERFIKGFGDSFEKLKHTIEDCRCKCAKRYEEDEDEDDYSYGLKGLRDDYNACMKWAFGEMEDRAMGPRKAMKRWAKLHPSLPIPRILQAEVEPPSALATMLLLFDVMPHWLESLEVAEDEESNDE